MSNLILFDTCLSCFLTVKCHISVDLFLTLVYTLFICLMITNRKFLITFLNSLPQTLVFSILIIFFTKKSNQMWYVLICNFHVFYLSGYGYLMLRPSSSFMSESPPKSGETLDFYSRPSGVSTWRNLRAITPKGTIEIRLFRDRQVFPPDGTVRR